MKYFLYIMRALSTFYVHNSFITRISQCTYPQFSVFLLTSQQL